MQNMEKSYYFMLNLIDAESNLDEIVEKLVDRLKTHQQIDDSKLLDCEADLNLLCSVLNLANNRKRKQGDDSNVLLRHETLEKMNQNVILPLVTRMNDADGRLDQLMEPLYRICLEHFGMNQETGHWLLSLCLQALDLDVKQPERIISSRRAAVRSLNCLLFLSQTYASMRTLLLANTNQLVEHLTTLLSTSYLGDFSIIIKKVLSLHDDNSSRLPGIWKSIAESAKSCHVDSLLLLCALADYFVSVDATSQEIYGDAEFWRLIQIGLSDPDTLCRKRALYLLKRAVDNLASLKVDVISGDVSTELASFCWSAARKKELISLWEDYILIVEMMEEKQVHIIKPLLPRWRTIVEASYGAETGAGPLLHTSWILVLLKRTLNHSSGIIVRWGMEHLLDLDAAKIPLIAQKGNEFLVQNLMEMLNQSIHYQREPSQPLNECPPLAEKIVTFLNNYWSAFGDDHPRRAIFFRELLESVDTINWSGIPLMFVMRAFSMLPKSPILNPKTMEILRNICSQHIRTVYVIQRGAIQVYATQIMIRLIDPSTVYISDVIRLLALIRNEESYGRGSRVWKQLSDWLKSVPWNDTLDQLEAMVLAVLCKTPESKYSALPPEVLCLGFAKLFYLCSDAHLLANHRKQSFLFPLFDTAASAFERPYLRRDSADNAVKVVVKLLDLKGNAPLDSVLVTLVDQSRSSLLDYAIQRLLSSNDLEDTNMYLSSIHYLLLRASANSLTNNFIVETAERFLNAVNNGLVSSNSCQIVSALMGVRGLATCVGVLECNGTELDLIAHIVSRLPALSTLTTAIKRPKETESSVNCRDWNTLVSVTLEAQWRLVAYNLTHCTDEQMSEDLFHSCLTGMDEGTNDLLEPVFHTLGILFSRIQLSSKFVCHCIDVCWRRLLECGPCPRLFWPAYSAFLRMCYRKDLMDKDDMTRDRLLLLAEEIQAAADDRNGIMYELAVQLTSVQETVLLQAYVRQLVGMAMFGPLHKKGDRIVQDLNVYISSMDDLEPEKPETSRDDSNVRVVIATFLTKLVTKGANLDILKSFALEAMEQWRDITRTRKRHTFVNSLKHRETHRLLTSLLLIHSSLICDPEIREKLLIFLCEVVEKEGQPSVRFLSEWILILILVKTPSKLHLILDNLSCQNDKKPALYCSWLTILIHVARQLPDESRIEFLQRAIPTVLPLCMAHQFNLRIFGQACLLALFEQCRQEGMEQFSNVRFVLEGVHDFISMSGNSSRCTMTLLEHFAFVYHPIEDFTIRTLFVTVPRLFGISPDEWLTGLLFVNFDGDFWNSSTESRRSIRLCSSRSELETCQPGAWKLRTDGSEGIDVMIGDVQRKITPWKRMLPLEDLEMFSNTRVKRQNDGLILVASLIDKPANLGGLCRSCEIFGASEFVIGSLAYVNDQQFVGLSVSAQKWLPITEVQPNFVRDYLIMQKRRGYTLVGVEQTNNSRCLSEYKFPDRTLLLLGNEKEGIPVDLIQLLDVCVEIPQQGVIRSLNVHVCGALLMWEYRRQHLS